ncbi:MAG: porin family protein [Candidatus Cryptobacteroides sp.]
MKKFRVILTAAALLVGAVLSAQVRYGVIGGATFSTKKFKEISSGTYTNFNAGLTLKVPLPLGFSFQPSLVYNVKGTKMTDVSDDNTSLSRFDLSVGYLELPLSVQWGPDLLICRPFLDVTPFVGYAVNNKMVATDATDASKSSERNSWTGLNRFEYGVGLGFGIEVWRIQVLARYNWNLGNLYNAKEDAEGSNFGQFVKKAYNNRSFGGITLTAAILFGGGHRHKK